MVRRRPTGKRPSTARSGSGTRSHRALAVDAQEADPGALLHHYRHLLQWRRTQPALVDGDLTLLPVDAQVLAFVRTHGDERLLCAFNLSTEPATLALPAGDQVDAQSTLSFDPYGVRFARLTRV